MSKRALLVGINQFTRPDWRLRGCINDTLDMRDVLTTYYGFKSEEIRVIQDKDATAQGIRDGLAWLLTEYGGDDVRVFSFSSHGTQVDDQSGDEWECKDEVIVPHDHSWDKPFRDDDLRAFFETIPQGVNFTFLADCCHSGTIQRDILDAKIDFKSRYLTPPKRILDRIEKKIERRDALADDYAAEQLAELAQKVTPAELKAKIREYMASFRKKFRDNRYGSVSVDRHILLAGCEDKQTSADAMIEGDYHGAFTWALCKAIRQSNGSLTYSQLIRQTAANLKGYSQKPQLECPPEVVNQRIFQPF
jgi:hypothetical protein